MQGAVDRETGRDKEYKRSIVNCVLKGWSACGIESESNSDLRHIYD